MSKVLNSCLSLLVLLLLSVPPISWGAKNLKYPVIKQVLASVTNTADQAIAKIPGTFSTAIVGDCDNDGKNELVAVANSSNQQCELRVYKRTPTGFTQVWSQAFISGKCSIAIGDANNDKKNEIVLAMDKSLVLFQFDKVKGYRKQAEVPISSVSGNRSLCIDDCDNDTYNEVIVGTGLPDRKLQIFRFRGNVGVKEYQDENLSDTLSVVGMDIDNDGKQEIVTGTSGPLFQDVWIYKIILNNYTLPPATRELEKVVLSPRDTNQVAIGEVEVACGDIDGDGYVEILATEGNVSEKKMGVGGARIFDWVQIPGNYATYKVEPLRDNESWKPVIGNILNNGKTQFAYISGNQVKVFQVFGLEFFPSWIITLPVIASSQRVDLRSGDIDNDGKNELIVSDDSSGILVFKKSSP